MTRDEIVAYIEETYSVEAEYPWQGSPHAVFRNARNRKWFAVILEVKEKHLGGSCGSVSGRGTGSFAETTTSEQGAVRAANAETLVDVLNLKEPPGLIEDLLHEDGYLPAYHMNKRLWVSVRMDGSVSPEATKRLIDQSYELVAPKRPAARKS